MRKSQLNWFKRFAAVTALVFSMSSNAMAADDLGPVGQAILNSTALEKVEFGVGILVSYVVGLFAFLAVNRRQAPGSAGCFGLFFFFASALLFTTFIFFGLILRETVLPLWIRVTVVVLVLVCLAVTLVRKRKVYSNAQ